MKEFQSVIPRGLILSPTAGRIQCWTSLYFIHDDGHSRVTKVPDKYLRSHKNKDIKKQLSASRGWEIPSDKLHSSENSKFLKSVWATEELYNKENVNI